MPNWALRCEKSEEIPLKTLFVEIRLRFIDFIKTTEIVVLTIISKNKNVWNTRLDQKPIGKTIENELFQIVFGKWEIRKNIDMKPKTST